MDIEAHDERIIETLEQEKARLVDALTSIVRRWEESEKVGMLACSMAEDAREALRFIGEYV